MASMPATISGVGLVEEYVRTDYRSFLRQLGAQGA
jgi:hypothetical protein